MIDKSRLPFKDIFIRYKNDYKKEIVNGNDDQDIILSFDVTFEDKGVDPGLLDDIQPPYELFKLSTKYRGNFSDNIKPQPVPLISIYYQNEIARDNQNQLGGDDAQVINRDPNRQEDVDSSRYKHEYIESFKMLRQHL